MITVENKKELKLVFKNREGKFIIAGALAHKLTMYAKVKKHSEQVGRILVSIGIPLFLFSFPVALILTMLGAVIVSFPTCCMTMSSMVEIAILCRNTISIGDLAMNYSYLVKSDNTIQLTYNPKK